jgi:hypothetical protein
MDDAAAQSLVWIDWRGPEPGRWVFADGVQAPTAVVSEHRVTAGRKQLTLVSPWTVSSRALENVIGNIPALRGVVPSSVLAWRETKCSSHGLLRRDDGTSVAGRAIHELVVFR